MSDDYKKQSLEVFFFGSQGRVQCRYYKSNNLNGPAVICLPPDPSQGATMENKIISSIGNVFYDAGFSVLKLNYHGIGRSEGGLKNEKDQINDISMALDWLKVQNPNISYFWICGYSFGSWMASNVMIRRPEIDNFIFIAPLADKYDYTILSPCPASGLLVHAEYDELTKIKSVQKLCDFMNGQNNHIVELEIINETGHLFPDKLEKLKNICLDYINTTLSIRITKPIRKKRRKRKKKDEII